jgi:hypothetical protein
MKRSAQILKWAISKFEPFSSWNFQGHAWAAPVGVVGQSPA